MSLLGAWEAGARARGPGRGGARGGPRLSRPHRLRPRAAGRAPRAGAPSSSTRCPAGPELGDTGRAPRRAGRARPLLEPRGGRDAGERDPRRPAAGRAGPAGGAQGPGPARPRRRARRHAHPGGPRAARGGAQALRGAGARPGRRARARGPPGGRGPGGGRRPLGRARPLRPPRAPAPPRGGQGHGHAQPAAQGRRRRPGHDRLLARPPGTARWAHREGETAVYQLFERPFAGSFAFDASAAPPAGGGALPELADARQGGRAPRARAPAHERGGPGGAAPRGDGRRARHRRRRAGLRPDRGALGEGLRPRERAPDGSASSPPTPSASTAPSPSGWRRARCGSWPRPARPPHPRPLRSRSLPTPTRAPERHPVLPPPPSLRGARRALGCQPQAERRRGGLERGYGRQDAPRQAE